MPYAAFSSLHELRGELALPISPAARPAPTTFSATPDTSRSRCHLKAKEPPIIPRARLTLSRCPAPKAIDYDLKMSSDAASPLASTSRDLLSSLPLAAEPPAASTSNLLASAAGQGTPSQQAPRRTNAQVLSDQLLAEGVKAEQSGRLLKDEAEMWNHNAW